MEGVQDALIVVLIGIFTVEAASIEDLGTGDSRVKITSAKQIRDARQGHLIENAPGNAVKQLIRHHGAGDNHRVIDRQQAAAGRSFHGSNFTIAIAVKVSHGNIHPTTDRANPLHIGAIGRSCRVQDANKAVGIQIDQFSIIVGGLRRGWLVGQPQAQAHQQQHTKVHDPLLHHSRYL